MFKINYLDKVDSTNIVARNYPFQTIICASEQTNGKGRFNRKWSSGKGGLWFSIILPSKRPLFEYTFIASLAILHSIKQSIKEIGIKWPNDIYFKNKKICGILSECVFYGNKPRKIIVGIGINVNNVLPYMLKKKAISLNKIIKNDLNISVLLKKILFNFEKINKLSSKNILKQYKSHCLNLGKSISVNTFHKKITGKAIDINNEGSLILEKNGKIIIVLEGDITIL